MKLIKPLLFIITLFAATAAIAQSTFWEFRDWVQAEVESSDGQDFDVFGDGSLIVNVKVRVTAEVANAPTTRPAQDGSSPFRHITTGATDGGTNSIRFSRRKGAFHDVIVSATSFSEDEQIYFSGHFGTWTVNDNNPPLTAMTVDPADESLVPAGKVGWRGSWNSGEGGNSWKAKWDSGTTATGNWFEVDYLVRGGGASTR